MESNFDLLQWKTNELNAFIPAKPTIELDATVSCTPEIRLKGFEVQGAEGAIKFSGSFGFYQRGS